MKGLLYFAVLAQQTWFVMVHLLPITLLLVAVWLWGLVASWSSLRGKTSRPSWLACLPPLVLGCVPPFLTPFGVLLCGVIFVQDPPWVTGVEAPAGPQYLILGLLVSHIPLTALLIWRWRPQWPVVLASAVVAAYVSVCAAFISGMSVTGVWL